MSHISTASLIETFCKQMPAPVSMESLGIPKKELAPVIAIYTRMESLIKTLETLKAVVEKPNSSIDTNLEKRALQIRCLMAKASMLSIENAINILQFRVATQSKNLPVLLSIQLDFAVLTGQVYMTFAQRSIKEIDALLKSLEVQKEELIIEDLD